ncbi:MULTISPECIES: hypothetical protein [Clostridium]|nr:hypothetical protein CLOSBL3_12194 [Clostridiaceae bacterium BL-3]
MNPYVLDFSNIDKSDLPLVGGKGANLGKLSKINDIMCSRRFLYNY